MKTSNCLILILILMGIPFFSCQGDKSHVTRFVISLVGIKGLKEREVEDFIQLYERRKEKKPFSDFEKMDKKEVKDTLLLKAARAGSHKIVRFMLNQGADVNFADRDGKTALHLVMMVEDNVAREEIIRLLTSRRIDLDKKDKNGNTSLHLAARFKRSDSVKQLFRSRKMPINIINEKNEQGWTAFMEAASNGDYEIVKYLAEQEAKVNIRDDEGMSALHLAVKNDDTKMVDTLFSIVPVNGDPVQILPDEQGETPMHHAAMLGNPKIVEALLNKKAKWLKQMSRKKRNNALKVLVNLPNDSGLTPLQVAVEHDHLKMVEFLFEKGALLNISADAERAVLFIAIGNNFENMVKLLLSLSPKPVLPRPNYPGWTPRYHAATPVHRAVELGNPEMVRALLSKDAAWLKGMDEKKKNDALKELVNLQDSNKRTPRDLALFFKMRQDFPAFKSLGEEQRKNLDEIIQILEEAELKKRIEERFGPLRKKRRGRRW